MAVHNSIDDGQRDDDRRLRVLVEAEVENDRGLEHPRGGYLSNFGSFECSSRKVLDIPTGSASAYVIVLDSEGQIIARVSGPPTEQHVSQLKSAVRSMK